VWLLAVVAIAAVVFAVSQAGPSAGGRAEPSASGGAGLSQRDGAEIGFRDQERLEEHHEKHGREFGDISQGEYLRRAQALRDAPVGGAILELKRQDGVITRFDRETGSFVAFDPDLIIRTFFRPNQGERYFRRQAARGD
jgi:hypothetical protein